MENNPTEKLQSLYHDKHTAEFVCDYCGALVSISDEKCPECKSIFSTIRCPQCKFSGKAFWFANGCPQCKYQTPLFSKNKGKPRQIERKLFLFSFLGLIILNIILLVYLTRLW